FIILSTSLDLQSFRREDIERAVGAIDAALSRALARGADVILQSGTPLAISLGAKGVQELIRRLRQKCGTPLLSSALNAVAAARAVNARRLAVANKWNERLNRDLAEFFSHWDIEVIAGASHAQEPAEFASADLRKSADLAYRVGRQALDR